MTDVIIAMAPLYIMAVYYYGLRPLLLAVASVLTCIVCQGLCSLLQGRRLNVRDLTPIVTGMMIPLMLPASINFTVVIMICLFAILVAKAPFGGTGENLFNPAAAGLAFGAICWSEQFFSYPMPFYTLEIFGNEAVRTGQNPATVLALGGVPSYDLSEILFGNVPGPMGAANILVIVACLVFLISRRVIKWYTPVSFLAAAALMAAIHPRAGFGAQESVLFELCSGSLLFGAAFMLGDPVTSPKRPLGRLLYGLAAGVFAMVIRWEGVFEQGIYFAILFANALSPFFDYISEQSYKLKRRDLREIKAAIRKAV